MDSLSPDDQVLARSYPEWPDKGPLIDGRRISIGTAKRKVRLNEEVRIVHVAEIAVPGHTVYVMGPKSVQGEYVDGVLVTEPGPASGDALDPGIYDGVTLPSPAVDSNYDITSYRFDTPGLHRIFWQPGDLKSNVLEVEVAGP